MPGEGAQPRGAAGLTRWGLLKARGVGGGGERTEGGCVFLQDVLGLGLRLITENKGREDLAWNMWPSLLLLEVSQSVALARRAVGAAGA